MNRRSFLAAPLALAPLSAASPAPAPASEKDWDGANSAARLTTAEARAILGDPKATRERRMSAMLTIESEILANLEVLRTAKLRCDRMGWRITLARTITAARRCLFC